MRIAQVICLYPPEHVGGAPQQCRRVAVELARRGHKVACFVGRLDRDAHMLAVSHERRDNIAVTRIVTTDAFDDRDERNWRHPGVEPAFRAFLEQHRPEVVHFHALQSLGASLVPVARDAGAAVVVTMHDLWWFCARLFCVDRTGRACIPVVQPGSCQCESGSAELARRAAYLRLVLQSAGVVVTPSHALAERVTGQGFGGRIEVVPNGVERPSERGPAPPLRAPSDRLRLVYTGGRHPVKGWQVLARALQLLAERCVEVEADLYGLDELVLLGQDASLLDGIAVRALPPFLPEQLDQVLAGGDVVVAPSLFESSSLVVREALLRGLPVVASECGGPQEVIEHGRNGILVAPDDPEGLADVLEQIDRDRSALVRLGQAAGATPVTSPEEHVDSLEVLYREITVPGIPGPSAPERPSLRRVVFVAGIEGSPLRYRVHHAMEQLGLLGVEAELFHHADPRAAAAADQADVLVVYRVPATAEMVDLVRRARRSHTPAIFDVDDLIFEPELSAELPQVRALPLAERRLYLEGVRRYRGMLEECGLGMASTAEIARHMEAIGVRAREHPNGVGGALAVASELARRHPRAKSGFAVGYLPGTKTHDLDLAMVADALAHFLDAHPDARFVLSSLARIPRSLQPMKGRIARVPFVPWPALPGLLATLDLNLVPLEEGVFNEAKSAIKWAEAALVEVPTLASSTEPFRRAIRPRDTGLIARDLGEWSDGLAWAYTHRLELRRMASRARHAAYVQGSPWVLGRNLFGILSEALEEGPRPVVPSGRDQTWPSERLITALEAPGLWPGRMPAPDPSMPAEGLGRAAISFRLEEKGLLARVDVLMATHLRPAAGPVTARVEAGDGAPSITLPSSDVGDNGWAAFVIEPPVALGEGASVRLCGVPAEHSAPWVAQEGEHFVNGHRRPGRVCARTFFVPPVPPEGQAADGTASTRGRPQWRGGFGLSKLVWRRARYWWKAEGYIGGSRRLLGAARRRAGVFLPWR